MEAAAASYRSDAGGSPTDFNICFSNSFAGGSAPAGAISEFGLVAPDREAADTEQSPAKPTDFAVVEPPFDTLDEREPASRSRRQNLRISDFRPFSFACVWWMGREGVVSGGSGEWGQW